MTIDEVGRLINTVRRSHIKTFFWTIYSPGLRLKEALHLQFGDTAP